ncbi:unnamed protein product, partial [Schistosoma mattheei]
MSDHCPSRQAILTGVSVGWKKGKEVKTKAYHQSMKSLDVGFGDFYPVQIVSLMHNRQVHDIVYAGQSASMEVYFLPKSWNSMNDKQRQSILHSISSPTSLSITSSYRTMNDHKKSFSLFGNNNDNICNDVDDNCTGNEENIPHNNKKKNNVNSLSSSPSDIYQFYSPIKIRRGMILLTYPMLLTAYSLFKTSSPGLLP